MLAEFSPKKGNFRSFSEQILQRVDPNINSKKDYIQDDYVFHLLVSDGLIFLCLADREFGRTRPFSFLEDIRNRFLSQYGRRWQSAKPMEMNSDFARVLSRQMDYFSNNPSADRIQKVRQELNEVKDILTDDIGKLLDRGEKMHLLVEKTEDLSMGATQFRQRSTQLKRHMCVKSCKMTIILIIVILVIFFIILLSACGGFTFKNC